jgi:hypothetical protein
MLHSDVHDRVDGRAVLRRLLREGVLRPYVPAGDDARLMYLAAALAPDARRTHTDKKGRAHPYAGIVVRDHLKVAPSRPCPYHAAPRLTWVQWRLDAVPLCVCVCICVCLCVSWLIVHSCRSEMRAVW